MKRLAVIGYAVGLLALVVASSASAGISLAEPPCTVTPEMTETRREVCEEEIAAWQPKHEQEVRQQKTEVREAEREEREESRIARQPTVRRPVAEALIRESLRRKEPSWSFRRSGFVDCSGGRINRTHWRCRFRWQTRSYFSWCGHGQVIGEEFVNGRAFFSIHWRRKPCYYGRAL